MKENDNVQAGIYLHSAPAITDQAMNNISEAGGFLDHLLFQVHLLRILLSVPTLKSATEENSQ